VCFAENGFDATSIREIAKKARANSALVNYYFGGKTGLYAEALRYIFSCGPIKISRTLASIHQPKSRTEAIQALSAVIESMVHKLMTCSGGSTLDRASLSLVTRELQNPREDVALLILEYMRQFYDSIWDCLKVLRPDLEWLTAMNYVHSIIGQVTHLHNYLALIRMLRDEPDYPSDLVALAQHITDFSLRGIGIPEALPGA
jgi:AcrR family transcriptional regulator